MKHLRARVRRIVLVVAAALAAAAGAAGPALAWEDVAHRVIADLAYERLTPAARAKVDVMIAQAQIVAEPSCPVASLADAAVFPDCVEGVRRYNQMRRWHEEAQPLCPAAARGDPCKNGECVSAAVKRALGVLADPAAAPTAKVLALEQVVHFIGDLHQPMNMIDNRDDAGRDVRVSLPGSTDRRLNLHGIWNDQFVAAALGGEEEGVRYVRPLMRQAGGWEGGDVDAWGAETTALARTLYSRLPMPPDCGRAPRNPEALDRGYVLSALPIVREQVAKAAVRLAAVLNMALR